jgi:hypothetical protein
MKKLIVVLFILPISLYSQCYNPFGNDTLATSLKQAVENYTMFNLQKSEPKKISSAYAINYFNPEGFAGLTISLSRKKILQGTELVYGEPTIFRIAIFGPAERLKKMADEYFYPLIQPCLKRKITCCFFWNNFKLSLFEDQPHNGIEMKYMEIEILPGN